MNTEIISSYKKQFTYYRQLAEKTFTQVNEKDLFWQYNSECNSIAMIVNHLAGNMLSRWTDFRSTDGEKEWRHRDNEFEDIIKTSEEMWLKWNTAWVVFEKALNSIQDKDLDEIIYIRNQGHTIREAINRQLAHYPYHIGQIVSIGKMVNGEKWISLSILKGQSKQYNDGQFSKGKRREHFTDSILDTENK